MRILVSRVEKDKNGTRTSSNFGTKMTPNILRDFTTVLWHIIRTQNLWNLFSIICLNLCPICECKIRQINKKWRYTPENQCFGSVSIWYGNPDPDPGFWDQKLKKIYRCKKNIFLN